MFPHIIEVGGEFVVRRWEVFAFTHWDTDGYWWHGYPHHWTRFPSPDAAREAWRSRKKKFRGWL